LLQVSQAGNLHLSAETYFDIVRGKTGALTEACTRLGAKYAGASDEVVESLSEYGRGLGIAFQIADDVLDLTGDESVAGKTLGTDIGQQKLTLPLIQALTELPEEDADKLRDALERGSTSEINDLIASTGAIPFAQAEARRIASAAKRAVGILPASSYRTALEQIAEWAIARDR
jgi:octaprenyl-diphosphate synthase